MPYTDLYRTRIPITAREASALARFALLLIILLLIPVLLFGQLTVQSPTFASLNILPDITGEETGGDAANTHGDASEARDNTGKTRGEGSLATRMARAANAATLTAPAVDLRNIPSSLERFAQRAHSTHQRADLRTFSGARIRDVIQLTWSTISAHELVGFEIERRSQRSGSWERIGFLRPSRRAENDYSFLDHLSGNGVMYYRLRQVRTDGSTIVSPIVSVTPEDVLESCSVWKHSTDAFRDYGTVSFGLHREANVRLTLLDRYGNTVKTVLDHSPMEEGHHVIPFGTGALAPGMYILRIHTGDRMTNLIFLNS